MKTISAKDLAKILPVDEKDIMEGSSEIFDKLSDELIKYLESKISHLYALYCNFDYYDYLDYIRGLICAYKDVLNFMEEEEKIK